MYKAKLIGEADSYTVARRFREEGGYSLDQRWRASGF